VNERVVVCEVSCLGLIELPGGADFRELLQGLARRLQPLLERRTAGRDGINVGACRMDSRIEATHRYHGRFLVLRVD
jgi:hypothetical protein